MLLARIEDVRLGGTGASGRSLLSEAAAFLLDLSTEAGIVALVAEPLTNELGGDLTSAESGDRGDVTPAVEGRGDVTPAVEGRLGFRGLELAVERVVLAVDMSLATLLLDNCRVRPTAGFRGRVSRAVTASAVALAEAGDFPLVGVLRPEAVGEVKDFEPNLLLGVTCFGVCLVGVL